MFSTKVFFAATPITIMNANLVLSMTFYNVDHNNVHHGKMMSVMSEIQENPEQMTHQWADDT